MSRIFPLDHLSPASPLSHNLVLPRAHLSKAWAAAADRRRRLASLTASFFAWVATRRRVAAVHRLTRRAAARRRRLALAGGFRALRLAGRRPAGATPAAAEGRYHAGGGGDTVEMASRDGDRSQTDKSLVGAEASVQEAAAAKAAMEEKVGQLRARLAQEKARALERRAAAREVADEVARSERERARYAQILRRQMEHPPHARAPTLPAEDGDKEEGEAWTLRVPLLLPPGGDTAGKNAKGGMEHEGGDASGGEESFLPPGVAMGATETTQREGELFGKVQAETLELRQRAAAAEKKEEQLRAEVSRKSAQTAAALETALVEGDRLKAEAEKREVIFVRAGCCFAK